jgi:hypothetical protein
MNEKAMRKSKSLKGKDKTEQVALQRRKEEEGGQLKGPEHR